MKKGGALPRKARGFPQVGRQSRFFPDFDATLAVAGRRLKSQPACTTIIHMSRAMRFSRSFTVDRSILDYLHRTHSGRSRSERVNELLHRAILEEQYEALEREAEEFFAAAGKTERTEARAFAAASRRTICREGD